ncbi:MAG: hypothetical protein ACR2QM_15420 [Longimicrobiales bacterium]
MKRVLAWGAWTLLLWFGAMTVGGLYMIGQARADAPDQAAARQIGTETGADFGAEYAGLILALSTAVAGAGAMTGVLPGTKPE